MLITIQAAPHKKHYFTVTKIVQLMLFMKTAVIYSEGHAKHTNFFFGQNAEF
jgi:hypothetical protein